MHESEHTVLANRFAAQENWSRASSEWNRVKARAGDLPMVGAVSACVLRVAVGKDCFRVAYYNRPII